MGCVCVNCVSEDHAVDVLMEIVPWLSPDEGSCTCPAEWSHCNIVYYSKRQHISLRLYYVADWAEIVGVMIFLFCRSSGDSWTHAERSAITQCSHWRQYGKAGPSTCHTCLLQYWGTHGVLQTWQLPHSESWCTSLRTSRHKYFEVVVKNWSKSDHEHYWEHTWSQVSPFVVQPQDLVGIFWVICG